VPASQPTVQSPFCHTLGRSSLPGFPLIEASLGPLLLDARIRQGAGHRALQICPLPNWRTTPSVRLKVADSSSESLLAWATRPCCGSPQFIIQTKERAQANEAPSHLLGSGVLFFTKGPLNKDTIGKVILKTSLLLLKVLKTKTSPRSNDGKCRSYHQLRSGSRRG
jgi:hypothetical protein